MRRPRRYQRERRRGALTERDTELLWMIGLLRWVRPGLDLVDVIPASRMVRRLRFLFDVGLVERVSLGGGSRTPDWYSLTSEGAAVVRNSGRPLSADVRAPRRPLAFSTAPHVELVSAAGGLILALERRGVALHSFALTKGMSVEARRLASVRLRPDLTAHLDAGRGQGFTVAVECEVGTWPLPKVKKKLAKYAAAFGQGLVDELWLAVPAACSRALALLRYADDLGIRERARVFDLAALRRRPPTLPQRGSYLT